MDAPKTHRLVSPGLFAVSMLFCALGCAGIEEDRSASFGVDSAKRTDKDTETTTAATAPSSRGSTAAEDFDSDDDTPPGRVRDLEAHSSGEENTIRLSWTAPGDDGRRGRASGYVVKRSDAPLTPESFGRAVSVEQDWQPQDAGAQESHVVEVPWYTGVHYLAIAAVDDAGRIGEMSSSLAVNTEPRGVLATDLVDFGARLFNNETRRIFVVRNESDLVDLKITSLRIASQTLAFDTLGPPLAAGPVAVPPGRSHGFHLVFSPDSPGDFSAAIEVRTNDPEAQPVLSARLLGKGVNASPEIVALEATPRLVRGDEEVKISVNVRDENSRLYGRDDVRQVSITVPRNGKAQPETRVMVPVQIVGPKEQRYEVSVTMEPQEAGPVNFPIVVKDAEGDVVRKTATVLFAAGRVRRVGDGQGHENIEQVIEAADDGDVISLEPGVYSGRGNKELRLLGKRLFFMSRAGPAQTTFDLEGTGRAFVLRPEDAAVFMGISFKNAGRGAFEIDGARVEMASCIFENNASDGRGGALRVRGKTSDVRITASAFARNRADVHGGGLGGAVWVSTGASVQIADCEFEENAARRGGAVWTGGHERVEMKGTNFVENRASDRGGAVWSQGKKLIVRQSAFRRNRGEGRCGGLWARGAKGGPCSVSITQSSFDANIGRAVCFEGPNLKASVEGSAFEKNASGAVESARLVDLLVAGSRFVQNRCVGNCSGAGVLSRGSAEVLDSVFDGNAVSADAFGGAIRAHGRIDVRRTRFQGNIAGKGGAVYLDPRVGDASRIEECTFVANRSGDAGGAVDAGCPAAIERSTFEANRVDAKTGCGAALHGFGGEVCGRHLEFRGNMSMGRGGAVCIEEGGAVLTNVLVVENTGQRGGGGIFADVVGHRRSLLNAGRAAVVLANATVAKNAAPEGRGGGIYWESGRGAVINTILWHNRDGSEDPAASADEILVVGRGSQSVSIIASDIDDAPGRISDASSRINGRGFRPGEEGNISSPPAFAKGEGGGYFLSQLTGGQRTKSPAVDAAAIDLELQGLKRIQCGRGAVGLVSQLRHRTTSSAGNPDAVWLDMGYHYPAEDRGGSGEPEPAEQQVGDESDEEENAEKAIVDEGVGRQVQGPDVWGQIRRRRPGTGPEENFRGPDELGQRKQGQAQGEPEEPGVNEVSEQKVLGDPHPDNT